MAHPSNSVKVNALGWYSASRISLYANGILAGVPSKKVSRNGKMYLSYHPSAMSSRVRQIEYPVLVAIFAAQHALPRRMCIVVSRRGDIDE